MTALVFININYLTQMLKHWQLWLISLTVIVLAIATGFIVFKPANKPTTEPSSTETVKTEGDSKNGNELNNQVENNQPKTFTSQKGVTITLENFNNTMSCPLIIKGSVSGVWFFEAEFVIQLISNEILWLLSWLELSRIIGSLNSQ